MQGKEVLVIVDDLDLADHVVSQLWTGGRHVAASVLEADGISPILRNVRTREITADLVVAGGNLVRMAVASMGELKINMPVVGVGVRRESDEGLPVAAWAFDTFTVNEVITSLPEPGAVPPAVQA